MKTTTEWCNITFCVFVGVSACVLSFAAFQLGKTVPVYDGAWVEWYLRSTPEQRASCPEDTD